MKSALHTCWCVRAKWLLAELRLFSTQPDYLISGEVLPVVNAGLTKYCSHKTSIIRNGDTLMEKLPDELATTGGSKATNTRQRARTGDLFCLAKAQHGRSPV